MRRLHRGFTSFRTGRALHRARGISLVVTVLLTMLAATIGLVVVRQAVLSTTEESGRIDFGRAQGALDDVQTQFERQLAANPTFYLTETFAYERPRLCAAAPDELAPSVVASIEVNPWMIPAQVDGAPQSALWPCGDAWSYPQVGQALEGWQWSVPGSAVRVGVRWVPQDFPVRAEVYPPTPAEPTLRLKTLATVGGQEVGMIVSYARSAASEWTIYSETYLNMSQLLGSGVGTSDQDEVVLGPGATTYSGKVTYLPTGNGQVAASTLSAEGGFVGAPGEGNRLIAPPELRNAVPQPLTMSSLRASAASLTAAGCPPVLGEAVCLKDGQVLTDVNGEAQTVPSTPAYLVMPAGDIAKPAVQVYTATQTPVYISECSTECSPRAASAGLVQAGLHPAVLPETGGSVWQSLGTFPYPATGVVATDADLYVGSCPGSVVAGASCEEVSFPASLTLWAGNLATSADLYVSSSVGVGTGFRLGLVASGQVKVGYWAAPAGSEVSINAGVVSMGLGQGDASGIGAVPYARPGVRMGETMGVRLTGSVAGEAAVRPEAVTRFSVSAQPLFATGAPPYMPGFSHNLQSVGTASLSSIDVCPDQLGQPSPSGGTRSTCLGLW